MFLGWYDGTIPEMPAPGYKWSETQKLNRDIWSKQRSRSMAAIRRDFDW